MKAIRNSFYFSSPFSGALRTFCSLKILSSLIICACYFFLKGKCLHFENKFVMISQDMQNRKSSKYMWQGLVI